MNRGETVCTLYDRCPEFNALKLAIDRRRVASPHQQRIAQAARHTRADELLLLLLVVLARTSGDRFTLAKATAQDPMDEWWLQRLRQTRERFVTM